jgi:NADH:ubiquinone oxidoreductase subunit H
MPYDYGEAESELIAGVTNELSGVSFSLLFLAEVSEYVTYAVINIVCISASCTNATMFVTAYVLTHYLPRILSARAYMFHVIYCTLM